MPSPKNESKKVISTAESSSTDTVEAKSTKPDPTLVDTAFPAVVFDGDVPVAAGVAIGQIDPQSQQFEGFLVGHDLPREYREECDQGPSASKPAEKSRGSLHGWSQGYENAFDQIDWGRVPKN